MKKYNIVLLFMLLLTVGLALSGCSSFDFGGSKTTYSVEITASEGGKVELSAGNKHYTINSGTTEKYRFNEKTKIELVATPDNDYAFSCWESETGESFDDPLTFDLTENIKTKAVFKYADKTITVIDGEGNLIKSFKFRGSGLYGKLLNEVTEPGYFHTFTLNNQNLTSDTRIYVTQDLTVVASKHIQNYVILYDLDGGAVSAANPTGFNIQSESFTLNNPTRYGYTFEGWTGEGLNNPTQTVTLEIGSIGDRTYTANWRPIGYSISYDLAGGTVATPDPTTYDITSEEIRLGYPTKEGYVFDGWIGTDLNQATLTVDIPAGSTGERSYTATWSVADYPLTYYLAGGTLSAANPTSYNIECEDITLNNPTKTGYTFAGWTGTDVDNKTETVTIAAGSTGIRNYSAHWTAKEYTLNFKEDGNTVKTEKYTIETERPQVTQEDGYYTEWKVAGTPWDEYDIFSQTDLTIDVDVYKQVAYKVTIKDWENSTFGQDFKNYNYDEESKTITFVYVDGDDPITLKEENQTPVREGFDFLYWSDGENSYDWRVKSVIIDTSIRHDQTFTAIWYEYFDVSYVNYTGDTLPTRLLFTTDKKIYEKTFYTMDTVRYYKTIAEFGSSISQSISTFEVTDQAGESLYKRTSIKYNPSIVSMLYAVLDAGFGRSLKLTLRFYNTTSVAAKHI